MSDIYENTHAPQVLRKARSTETHERKLMKLMHFIQMLPNALHVCKLA